MRILVVHPGPNFSVADMHDGWVEALRGLGCEVASYELDTRIQFYGHALISTGDVDESGHPLVRRAMSDQDAIRAAMQGISHACFSMWPDVVLFVSGFFVTPGIMGLLQQRRMKTVLLASESPYQEKMQLERAQCSDIVLLNDPVNIGQYRALGVTAEYSPHAYRPAVHYPRRVSVNPNLNADLAFIGTGFASRIDFFEKMNLDGLDVLLGGCWPLAAKSPLRQYMGHDIATTKPPRYTATPNAASTSTAANTTTPTTRPTPHHGPWDPGKLSRRRARCRSCATPAPRGTRCCTCSPRSPGRKTPARNSAGSSATTRNGRR